MLNISSHLIFLLFSCFVQYFFFFVRIFTNSRLLWCYLHVSPIWGVFGVVGSKYTACFRLSLYYVCLIGIRWQVKISSLRILTMWEKKRVNNTSCVCVYCIFCIEQCIKNGIARFQGHSITRFRSVIVIILHSMYLPYAFSIYT